MKWKNKFIMKTICSLTISLDLVSVDMGSQEDQTAVAPFEMPFSDQDVRNPLQQICATYNDIE